MVGVTDTAGFYRLNNLPPGVVTVTADLPGFSTYKREGVDVRAGATFSIDIVMKVGALAETITVSGASPMVATGPTKTLAITGDLMRAAPISSRRGLATCWTWRRG